MMSFWEKDSFYANADITIIGGGLMGLWTAIELKKKSPTLSITILERGTTPLGASTRNGGFACFGSLTELLADEATMGTEKMLSVVEMRFKGIQKIRSHFTASEIDLDECGGYEVLKNYKEADEIDEQINYLNQLLAKIIGSKNAFACATDRISTIGLKNIDQLIHNPHEAGIHSGKLVNALIKVAINNGIQVLNGIEVMSWEELSNKVVVLTNQQKTITTNQLIVCTNGFTNSLLPELNIEPARGQIIITAPIDGLKTKGTFHFDEGFYYWRNIGDRILLGGARNSEFENERTTDLSGSDSIRNKLLEFLKNHLVTNQPILVEQYWSGIMGFTPTKTPLVKKVGTNVLAVIACNGMGVALTPIIAEEVANQLLN